MDFSTDKMFTLLYLAVAVIILWSGIVGNTVGLALGILLFIGTVLLRLKSLRAEESVENNKVEVNAKNED